MRAWWQRTGSWSSSHKLALAAIVLLSLGGGTSALGQRRSGGFPHQRHAGLFPVCTGCHTGIPTGDQADFYPSPQLCARCHDGTHQRRVDWNGPSHLVTNLRFDHARHPRQAAGQSIECGTCHTEEGAARMAVREAVVPRCLSCHAHQATQHFVDANCRRCHVPLASTSFSRERIENLPVPPDHLAPDFLSREHGALAQQSTTRCAVCHVQQRCTSCHVDPAVAPPIASIPAAPAALQLPRFAAHYSTPASHLDTHWLEEHGARASVQSCATCHTRNDCTACHVQPLPSVVQALPQRPGAQTPAAPQAPGVLLSRHAPPSHAAPGFGTQHATLAEADQGQCASCHTRRFCEDCHDTPARATFHPPDFMARHPTEAYGRKLECANCHNTQVFCRDCHKNAGMTPVGRLENGFHDAQPLWLFRHGQAARQGLESCASCHAQKDCLQCHSALGSFQVNPHGPGFDARRAQKRNPAICLACHLTDPLNGGAP